MKTSLLPIASFAVASAIVLTIFAFSTRLPKERAGQTQNSDTLTISEPTVTFADPVLGKGGAPITIVEFGDYQCEACKDFSESFALLRAEMPDSIRLVWKDFPNDSAHIFARDAAISAHCAGRQGMYWEFHDKLFTQQDSLSPTTLPSIAEELKLDAEMFNECVSTRETEPLVDRGLEEALALRLTASPTIFIAGERYVGAMTAEELEKIVREKLITTKQGL